MATRLSNPAPRFFYDNGEPLSSGKMWFYEPGTTTPKNTYSDNGLTTPNTNPVILSSSGLMPNIFLDGVYKVLLTDKDDVQQSGYPRDNINSLVQLAFLEWDSTLNYGIGGVNIVYASDGNYYVSIQNNNLGHDPTVSPLWWTPLFDYLIEYQGVVGNNEVAVGDTATGLKGIAITNGHFVVGDTTNGIAGLALTTKGSFFVGDGAGAPTAFPVGTNGQYLVAQSGEATGLLWTTPAPPTALVYLSTVNAAAATNVDIETGFGSTYDNYVIIFNGVTFSGADVMNIRFKLSGAYVTSGTYGRTTTNNTAAAMTDTSGFASGSVITGIGGRIDVYDVNSALAKTVQIYVGGVNAVPQITMYRSMTGNTGTGVLTGIRLFTTGGATITGTFRLYGVVNS
jgi:hypothetical protein